MGQSYKKDAGKWTRAYDGRGRNMAELCADCGASYGSPADLIAHVRKAHSGGNSLASLSMNPESRRSGLVGAMCGRHCATMDALTRHHLSPHPPTTRRAPPTPGRRLVYY